MRAAIAIIRKIRRAERQWLGNVPDKAKGERTRADLRFHRRLVIAAAEWKTGSGGLWRPPQLELLNTHRERAGDDFTSDQQEFAVASKQGWRKELDRKRWTQRLVAGLAIVLAVALSFSVYYWRETVRERDAARQQRAVAQTATGQLLGNEAQRLLTQPITQDTSPVIAALAATGWRVGRASDAWNAMQRAPLLHTIGRAASNVFSLGFLLGSTVAFSPGGRLLVSTDERISDRGQVRITLAEDGRELARISYGGSLEALAFSPDSGYLAIGSGEIDKKGEARIVAIDQSREIAHFAYSGPVTALAFSLDGRHLAAGSWDGTTRIISVSDGRSSWPPLTKRRSRHATISPTQRS